MKNSVVKVLVLGLLGSLGCGDKSPAEKCDDLVSMVCDRAVECIPGASGMHEACVQAVDQGLACRNTKSVGPSYDRCMSELDAQSCQTLFPVDGTGQLTVDLPADCQGVLSTQTARRGEADPGLLEGTPLAGAIRGMAGARTR